MLPTFKGDGVVTAQSAQMPGVENVTVRANHFNIRQNSEAMLAATDFIIRE